MSVFLNTQRLHHSFFELAMESLKLQREGHLAQALVKAQGLDVINSDIGLELKLFFKKIQMQTVGQFA
jgi:hypothetical protein